MATSALARDSNAIVEYLLTQVCHHVQISEEQHEEAEARYRLIEELFERHGSPLIAHRPSLFPQGSLAIGTTTRPRGREEFDLDIVCELSTDATAFPDPTVLISGIAAYLEQQPLRGGTVTHKNRCVRVSYAPWFHLDILPACKDSSNGGTCLLVPDRQSRAWKRSNPRGFTSWYESRAALTLRLLAEKRAEPIPPKEAVELKPVLKLATQLLKRERDQRFAAAPKKAPISIVLTTLAGMHYQGSQSIALALVEIVDGVLASVPTRGRLVVLNPANAGEDLSERWDLDRGAYVAFVDGMKTLRDELDAITERQSFESLARLFGPLFGEELTKVVLREYGREHDPSRTGAPLYSRRNSGIIERAATIAPVVPMARHTFYGE